MKSLFFALIISTISIQTANARLLDKIVAVINDKVITLSQVKRIQGNVDARRNISPLIFTKSNYTVKEIVKIMIHRHIIRTKLAEVGYIISDEQVEAQIKDTESRLGLNRERLLDFLNSNGVTFDEYFELVRETYEFNIFNQRVITPLISVTEQEIKNAYYKENLNNKTLTFKYTLVDFSLEKSRFKKGMLKRFRSTLIDFQANGVLPAEFSKVSTNVLGDITEDGLTKSLKTLLKRTDEGAFTSPTLIGGYYHVFYVKKKDLVESEIFQKSKGRIRAKLYTKLAKSISDLYFRREENKFYIKYFY